jgi:very-short-patch-repair endonuclease
MDLGPGSGRRSALVGVERERALAELATRQHGVVARRQLLALGVTERSIERWLSGQRLHEVHREVFSVGHRRVGERGRWWAGVLAYGDGAVLSHRSAAALWGLARQRSAVEVTAPRGRQGVDRRIGAWIHRCRLRPEDRTVRDGLPVTTVARTLFDLAEVLSPSELRRAWEEADRLHLLRLGAVEQACERGHGRRALRPIRRLLAAAQAPPQGRSPLEERFGAFVEAHRLPPPATNVTVLGREVDALWPAARLIAELDSWEFHRHRDAFEGDRSRDARFLLAGYRTIRVTHRRLDAHAETLAAQIRALLAAPAPSAAPTPAPA